MAVWPYGLGSNVFFIAFGLNMQKIIKKIAFLVKMAKVLRFRPNHKIFSGFVARSELKIKVHRNSYKRSYLTKIIGSPFSTHSNVDAL
jgi:hypothetical protein